MLEKSKSVSFSGRSLIDGQLAATFSANVYDENDARNNNDNISMMVSNNALYDANKEAVRNDLQDFQKLVWAEQDKSTKTPDSK
ncbi:hypothetical protein ACM28P_01190 [Lactobacillus crispatus]|uniref:hypothetical protein n=1 Tax=Lactobacillus crispatus TaxID=47770 RepID=UPI0039F64F00